MKKAGLKKYVREMAMCRILKIVSAGILAVLVCSLVCMGYQHGRILIDSPTGASDVVSVPNSLRTNMSEGFAWFRMDANGYNNVKAYHDVDVLVMGGSHVQGVQISQKENMTYKMEEYLSDMIVYNVGESAHYVDTCMNNLDNACIAFAPRYVIIDINSMSFSISNMQAVLDDTYQKMQAIDNHSWYRMVEDYVPMVMPFIDALRHWRQQGAKIAGSSVDETEEKDYQNILDEFLLYAQSVVSEHDCTLIFLYHPNSYAVTSDGVLQYEDDSEALSILQTACDKHGIVLVNTKEENIRMYEEQRVLPNGFVNTSLGKGHLNRYGHEAAAKVLADTIMELERNAD